MFKTVMELRKEMMKAKVSDKAKASILNMLLAEVLKIAKEDKNREANDADVKAGIKRMIKVSEQSVALNVPGAKEELEYLSTLVPKMKTKEELLLILAPMLKTHGKT